VKTIEIADATAPLADYTRANRRHTLVVTRRGRPVAALLPISTSADLESLKGDRRPTEQVRRALAARRARRIKRP
jgi:prevent-host-death family protein